MKTFNNKQSIEEMVLGKAFEKHELYESTSPERLIDAGVNTVFEMVEYDVEQESFVLKEDGRKVSSDELFYMSFLSICQEANDE